MLHKKRLAMPSDSNRNVLFGASDTMKVMWYVYILECGDGTLYTGTTTDVARRVDEHRSGTGAKYTASRGVKRLVYTEKKSSRSSAQKREAEIKNWTRLQKTRLIQK
jgi:putative endonuclease